MNPDLLSQIRKGNHLKSVGQPSLSKKVIAKPITLADELKQKMQLRSNFTQKPEKKLSPPQVPPRQKSAKWREQDSINNKVSFDISSYPAPPEEFEYTNPGYSPSSEFKITAATSQKLISKGKVKHYNKCYKARFTKLTPILYCLELKSAKYIKNLFRQSTDVFVERISDLIRETDEMVSAELFQDFIQQSIFDLVNGVKMYFRTVYPSHLPSNLYSSFINLGTNQTLSDEKIEKKMIPLTKLIMKQSPYRALELKQLLGFLKSLEETEKLIIAHHWGPVLLKPKFASQDLEKVMIEQKGVNRIIKIMIIAHEELFPTNVLEESLTKQD